MGNGIYKTVVYGRFPLSHVAGLALLAILAPIAFVTDNLMVGGLTTLIMMLVAGWKACRGGGCGRRTRALRGQRHRRAPHQRRLPNTDLGARPWKRVKAALKLAGWR
ncbi:hypothetical protein WJ978_24795 [Achromobacter xylosoxidans]